MHKIFLGLLSIALFSPAPVRAESKSFVPRTISALGCMKLKECTKEVYSVKVTEDLNVFGDIDLADDEAEEINALLAALTKVNVDVYIADTRYFPRGMRAVYYTDNNTVYLNGTATGIPVSLLKSLRHEAWHTAQDCMAGTIDNTFIAVIFNDDQIPERYRRSAELRYGTNPFLAKAVPWEQGAIYAGATPNLTVNALEACGAGEMWNAYKPTPMTREWLVDNGYIL